MPIPTFEGLCQALSRIVAAIWAHFPARRGCRFAFRPGQKERGTLWSAPRFDSTGVSV